MTGGGAAQVPYVHEPDGSYAGSPSDTDYKLFGRNQVIEELDFSNDLIRQRNFSAEVVNTLAGNFEGAFRTSFDVANPWWLNHVYGGAPTASGTGPYDYKWSVSAGRFQSARVYAGVDFLSGTAERQLEGVIFPQATLDWTRGDPLRATLIGVYGNETKNTSLTPGSQPSEQSDPLVFHGGGLEIPNATSIAKIQSGQLTLNSMGRLQRDMSRFPTDAVVAAPTYELTARKIINNTDFLELAYGATGGPDSYVEGESTGSLDFSSAGNTALNWEMTDVTPQDAPWDNIGNAEQDIEEAPTFTIDSLKVTAVSDQSSAR